MARRVFAIPLSVPLFGIFCASCTVYNGMGTMDQEPKTGLVIENDLERFGIEIIAPDDPRFEAEFKTYTGDSQTVLPLLDAAMPLAFFLRNHAEHEIVGISFRWVTTDPSGKSRVRETSVNHPGALIGMKPRDPWMVGKTSIVNP